MKKSSLNLSANLKLSPSKSMQFKDSQEEQSHIKQLNDKFKEIAKENDKKEAHSMEIASRTYVY